MAPPAIIAPLARADEHPLAGGKARGLARLIARGAPVPDGIVVLPGALDAEALARAVAPLGPRLAVRSSSTLEDGEASAAPGVFASEIRVPRGDLIAAIERVRASANSEAARRYAAIVGARLPDAMAVVVQTFVEGESGTLYTRAPGAPDRLMLASSVRSPRLLDARDPDPLAALARALDSGDTPAGLDIEWVDGADTLWIVQCRPVPPTPAILGPSEDAFAFAQSDPATRWCWDVAHNPDPLSAAHQGLVAEMVDRLGAPLRVVCGYLYEVCGEATPEEEVPDPAALEALFFADIEPDLDARLQRVESAPPDLESAIDVFTNVHRRYAELAGPLRAARRAVGSAPGLSPPIGAGLLAAVAACEHFTSATRRRAATAADAGEAAYWEPLAPRWDVDTACFGEDPERLADALAALSEVPRKTTAPTALAAITHAVRELDDRLFYRAQRAVRRAILALPPAAPNDDRFDRSLTALRQWHATGIAPTTAAPPRATRRRMPLVVQGADHIHDPPAGTSPVLRGRGSGGQSHGVARRRPGALAIVVARDLTPGEVLEATAAAGIILEGSHLLSHAAAMARACNIPIITGVAGATTRIREGDAVWMDGLAGLVVLGGEPAA